MKNTSLIICIILVMVFMWPSSTDWLQCYGLTSTSALTNRVLYLTLHANALHLSINMYAFLILSFLSRARSWNLFASALIAVTIPNALLSGVPMVGFSTVIYAMTGMILVSDSRWKVLVAANVSIMMIQGLLIGIAWLPHLYCFAAGLLVGLVFTPRLDR